MRFKQVLTFIIALLILFADSGQTIYARTCLKSKQTHLSLTQPKGCCGTASKHNSCHLKKSACCEVSAKLLKGNFINSNLVNQDGIALPALLYVANAFSFSSPQPAISKPLPSLAFLPPGIVAGAFTHTFRI